MLSKGPTLAQIALQVLDHYEFVPMDAKGAVHKIVDQLLNTKLGISELDAFVLEATWVRAMEKGAPDFTGSIRSQIFDAILDSEELFNKGPKYRAARIRHLFLMGASGFPMSAHPSVTLLQAIKTTTSDLDLTQWLINAFDLGYAGPDKTVGGAAWDIDDHDDIDSLLHESSEYYKKHPVGTLPHESGTVSPPGGAAVQYVSPQANIQQMPKKSASKKLMEGLFSPSKDWGSTSIKEAVDTLITGEAAFPPEPPMTHNQHMALCKGIDDKFDTHALKQVQYTYEVLGWAKYTAELVPLYVVPEMYKTLSQPAPLPVQVKTAIKQCLIIGTDDAVVFGLGTNPAFITIKAAIKHCQKSNAHPTYASMEKEVRATVQYNLSHMTLAAKLSFFDALKKLNETDLTKPPKPLGKSLYDMPKVKQMAQAMVDAGTAVESALKKAGAGMATPLKTSSAADIKAWVETYKGVKSKPAMFAQMYGASPSKIAQMASKNLKFSIASPLLYSLAASVDILSKEAKPTVHHFDFDPHYQFDASYDIKDNKLILFIGWTPPGSGTLGMPLGGTIVSFCAQVAKHALTSPDLEPFKSQLLHAYKSKLPIKVYATPALFDVHTSIEKGVQHHLQVQLFKELEVWTS